MRTVVEQIKDRLPITEVLSSYITVEQSGNQYKAKCPFHNERTASFSISPERGVYYCFGCGAKGDIFSFVSAFEGLDFKGALKVLAERAGVPLGAIAERTDTDPLYDILDETATRYTQTLAAHPDVLAYLTSRGVLKETIEAFRIGYAPDTWRYVTDACIAKEKRVAALKAGLIKETEGKTYDRFRKRIMFPLMDSGGRVIGFSGRLFPDDGEGAKYLNSPETALFQKSKTLFGFDKAKLAIKKHNFAILVEGQMDLVLSHQAGFKNTVATSGTAVSEEAATDPFSNLSVLARLTPHLFLAFDGDDAGQKAMDRAALVALSLGMNPKVVVLPQGVDPADYIIKEGAEAWKERLKEAKHFIVHHLERIRTTESSPHMFVKTIKSTLFPFLSRVASPMERAAYVAMIAQDTGLSPADISAELASLVTKTVATERTVAPAKALLTTYERLTAMRKRFGSSAIEEVCAPLETLSVGEFLFTAPAIADDRLEYALHQVEVEYGTLSDLDRLNITKELVEKVTSEFLGTARHHFSARLKSVEGDNKEEARILLLLSEITMRRIR